MWETQQEAIVGGPSKFELMLGLFDHTDANKRTVTFTVRRASRVRGVASTEMDGTAVKIAIDQVGRESGDGESWLFEGSVPGGAKSVTGYYSTRTNTGWLKRSIR
jgi:hypothetical protein